MSKQNYKELYKWYKEHNICPQCGSNRAAPHRVRCEECLLKNAESSQKQRDKSAEKREKAKENHRSYLKSLREERKKNGLCIYCGKPQSQNSTCMCIDCRIKNQRKNEKRKQGISRSERPLYGICYRCGKREIVPGKKLCRECAEKSTIGINAANNSPKTLERRNYIRQQNNAIFGRMEDKEIGSNINIRLNVPNISN